MTTIERYRKMLAHLCDHGLAENYAAIARKTGVNEVQISRVRNGKVKSVKEDTMRKVNSAYGNIFNPDWMRGQSDVMLAADLEREREGDGGAQQPAMPDMSSLVNAIIAANDQTIMSLKRELAAKEEVIAELRGRLADKEEMVRQKDRQIALLEQQLLGLRLEKGVSTGLQVGVAEATEQESVQPRT